VLLLDLNWFLILLVLHLLLSFLSLDFFPSLEIGIENHPLGGLKRESGANWRVSFDTLFSEWHVEGLGRSLLEIELISKRFLLGVFINLVVSRIITEFLLNGSVHFVEKSSIHFVFVIPLIFLISGIIRVFQKDAPIHVDVEHEMLNLIVSSELSVIERELTEIVWSLRIVGVQSLNDLLILLLSGKLFLVNAAHIGLIHHKILFIFNVIRDLLLDDLSLLLSSLGTLGGLSSWSS